MDAFRSLLVSLSDQNLERLEEELKQRFGHVERFDIAGGASPVAR
jgi:hypothetical protein